jgi:hypothetical protein
VNVTVDFVGVFTGPSEVDPFNPIPVELAEGPAVVLPPDPGGPSGGDVVSGSVSFETDNDQVKNLSGSLPIAAADPPLESATVSPVERLCEEPCVTIGPIPPPLIPLDETHDRGTLSVDYAPNEIFDPTFDNSVEWLQAAIIIAAPVAGDPPRSSFLDLLGAEGALPIQVDYTRISRGNLSFPGIDRDDCGFFTCATFSATVTSGAVRVGDSPAPIPVPPAIAALLAALAALAALRRPARL